MFISHKIENQIVVLLLIISIVPSLLGIFLSEIDKTITNFTESENNLNYTNHKELYIGPSVKLIPFESHSDNKSDNQGDLSHDFLSSGAPDDLPSGPINPYPSVSVRQANQSGIFTSTGTNPDDYFGAK